MAIIEYIGNPFQTWTGIGKIDKDFDLGVINKDDVPDHWLIYFTLRTQTHEGFLARLNCRASGQMAYNMFTELRQGDVIYATGELFHAYDVQTRAYTNKVHILGWSYLDVYDGVQPAMSPEKQEWLKKCSDLFDESAPLPTEEDAIRAREIWNSKRKKGKKE